MTIGPPTAHSGCGRPHSWPREPKGLSCRKELFGPYQFDVVMLHLIKRAADAAGRAAGCQPAHRLRQAEDAVAICWASLLVWGALLVVYVAREALRQTEDGLHLVGGETVATFVDVLMVQEQQGQGQGQGQGKQQGLLHEPRSTAFRRQDGMTLYLPPLPQAVIRKLGIVSTDSRARRASVATSASRSAATLPEVPEQYSPIDWGGTL